MTTVDFHIESEALGDDAALLRWEGREAMNELTRARASFVFRAGHPDPEALLGAGMTVVVRDPVDALERRIALVATGVEHEDDSVDGPVWAVDLAPPEHALTLRAGYRVFQEKTGPAIVEEMLVQAGFAADRIAKRLAGAYLPRLYCVQYGEGDWSFLERLCAEEGIAWWFDHDDEGPLLVLGDGADAHASIEGEPWLPFAEASGMVRQRALTSLEVTTRVVPTAFEVRDHDVRHPDVAVTGMAGDGLRALYEVPARVTTPEAATARATVRLQQARRDRIVATGRGDCARLQAGRVVTVIGELDEEVARAWLVVAVDHLWVRSSRGRAAEDRYENVVTLVPHGEVTHRPAAPASRPIVDGVETAITTGPSGEEIHTNDLGELKLRFPWDRSGIFDDTSSTWVRCLQMALGGSMLIPRVGWEVPVVYYDGDPDRPLVLGRLYNAEGVVPYGLPAAAATTALQSATSPGDGTTNEIRMADSGGSQEMFIHASRDQSVLVGGSATTTIGSTSTHDVTLSLQVGIDGDQTLDVSGSQKVGVTKVYSTGITGARTESVGAVEHEKVIGNRVVSVTGAYTELVGALYGIQSNQHNVDVTGAFAQTIGGSLVHTAGLGTSESVGGARGETVGGARIVRTRSGYAESVTGAKSTTAGACRVKAAGLLTTTTKGALETTVGGSATVVASGTVVVQANQIEITAAKLDAGALALSGGKLEVSKGKAKLDGPIKRKGGSKVG